MIISNRQARLAAKYLRTSDPRGRERAEQPSPADDELVERLRRELTELPETREDRVRRGRALLDMMPSAADVARKILSRIVSDSLR
ncbi:MAG: hypothetical protein IBX62_01325 [Coriobacteriia bacterium]|nr:hypothetical protein [Coriobacteriia bacterium]